MNTLRDNLTELYKLECKLDKIIEKLKEDKDIHNKVVRNNN